MVTEELFRGGSKFVTPAADYPANRETERLLRVDGTAGVAVVLPDARRLKKGFVQLVLVTAGSVPVKNAAGGAIVTTSSPRLREFRLLDNTTQAGTWAYSPSLGITQGAAL